MEVHFPEFFYANLAGAALPLMTILLGNFVNLFGGFVSPNTPTLTPPPSRAAFNHEASLEFTSNY